MYQNIRDIVEAWMGLAKEDDGGHAQKCGLIMNVSGGVDDRLLKNKTRTNQKRRKYGHDMN